MNGRKSLVRAAVISGGLLIAVAAVAYALVVRPFMLRGTQVANLEHMRRYDLEIRSYWQAHGSFPRSFSGLDSWGHPVSYVSDGTQYLLVSYGRGGRPDGSDYTAMRSIGELRNEPCADVNADIIFADRGELRNCGK